MTTRRILYGAVLAGCVLFFMLYRQWLSWIVLLTVIVLPFVSLVLSLPAMRSVTVRLRCPEKVRKGMPVRTALEVTCQYPVPPVRCRIRLHNVLSGQRFLGFPGERVPTGRCGMIRISYEKLWICDYLGLFRRKMNQAECCLLYVLPRPIRTDPPPKKESGITNLWRPKPGGGFSEEHDLRLYRPGDDLRQIHWKMSAKTGKLIYREPIEPVLQGYLVTLSLSGTPKAIEQKLSRLAGLGQELLDRQLSYRVQCLTGEGLQEFAISHIAAQEDMLCKLLGSTPQTADVRSKDSMVLWQHHIGGDSHEA